MDAVAARDGGWDDARTSRQEVGDEPVVAYDLALGFPEFYAAHREPIGRALALTLGDADLAAEATDEAMARAYLRWSQVSSMDNPAGWTYRVGLNWGRSTVRRLRRPRAVIHEPDSVEMPMVVEPTLVAALQRLNVKHRSVVVCRYLLGYSDAETAHALSLRPGTVRSCLHRALRTLALDLGHLRDADSQEGMKP